MALAPQLVLLLVTALGLGEIPPVHGELCLELTSKQTWVPIVPFSCKKRDVESGSCSRTGIILENADFQHRGSELNNGRFTVLKNREECCGLCRATFGCRVWSFFVTDKQFNDEGVCWLKSSAPKPLNNTEGLTVGMIKPPVADPKPCNQEVGVGIRGVVPYNNPKLLYAERWEICCDWCQSDNEFCTAWMWSSSTNFCKLYGNVVGDSNKHLCRDCVSGTREAARDLVKKASHCNHGGTHNVKYTGSGRVVLAPSKAFITKTSKECCGLCDAIKDCRAWSWSMKTEECSLNGEIPRKERNSDSFGGEAKSKVCNQETCQVEADIEMVGKSLFCSQGAAPSKKYLVVDNHQQCCLRCQEFPECKAWSFSHRRTNNAYSTCSLQLAIPDQNDFTDLRGINLGRAWSGIIPSRCNKHETEEFNSRVTGARAAYDSIYPSEKEDTEPDKSDNGLALPVQIVVVVVAGAVVLCCICISAAFCMWKSRQNQAYNGNIKEGLTALVHGGGLISGVQYDGRRTPDLSTYSTSDWGRHPNAVELTNPAITSPSSYSKSYEGSNVGLTAKELEFSEERLATLKKRMSTLKSPSGRFSSSMDHYEDAEWMNLNDILSNIQIGTELGGKYIIESGIHMGDNSIVMNAKQKFNSASPVVLKFFRQQRFYDIELSLYKLDLEFPYIPQVFDVYEPCIVASWGLPPLACIVMERGNFTLSEWLQRHQPGLDHMDQRNILFKICKAVQYFHENEIVHRDLKPDNIVIFSDALSWKLIDFGSWAKKGSTGQLEYTLRYAAPELLVAHATEDVIQVMPSSDMWSLGVIFWEVLTGDPLFGQEFSKEEVMAMLLGVEPLPYERHPEMWHSIQQGSAKRLVESLLQRDPIKRWTIQKVLQNGFFMTAPDTMQLREGHQEYANALKVIAGVVDRVDGRVQQVKNIAIENLKQTIGSVLIACFSFYEIDPAELTKNQHMDSEVAEMYANNSLKMQKALIEPSYNVFKRAKEEPAMLLRLERIHMLKITLMYGSDVALDLPISEIVSARITPSGSDGDSQDIEVFMMFHKGHLMECVGLWKTMDHRSTGLKLVGNSSIEICIGVKIIGSDDIVEIRKTVDLRMHPPSEKFKVVKQFYRTKEWYSNLPPWAKIYIHGAVAVASLASKIVF